MALELAHSPLLASREFRYGVAPDVPIRDRRIARTVAPNAPLRDELEARLQRDCWIYEREEIESFTASAVGDPHGDLLVVRAHVRQGTEPIVRERSPIFGSTISAIHTVARALTASFSLRSRSFLELVHVIRPSNWTGKDGALMLNESQFKFGDGENKGLRTSWHKGEFLTIQQSSLRTSVLWSTDLSLGELIEKLRDQHAVEPTAEIDYETAATLPAHPREQHAGTWAELEALVGDGGEDRVGSVTVTLGDLELWWGLPNRGEHERFPMIALTFASRVVDDAVAEYVEGTGTMDVRAKGRAALAAFAS